MKRIRHFSRKLALCVLLACSLSVNASAEKSVSVFAATDRHAQYETVAVEKETTEAAQETPQPESSKKEPPKRSGRVPAYDANGSLIWHNHLTDVLTLVRQDRDAVQPDIVLLGGDNIGEGSDSSKDETGYPMGAPPFSMKAVDAQIAHVFGDAARGLYTYGSHDKNETGTYTDVFFSGPVPCDGYYLYEQSFEKETRRPRFTDELMGIADICEIMGEYGKAADTYDRIIDLLENEWGFTEDTGLKQARKEKAWLLAKVQKA